MNVAETILINRAFDKKVSGKIVKTVKDFKAYLIKYNQPVHVNPGLGNIAGWITTLEDKSLGCIQNGGTDPVMDVIHFNKGMTLFLRAPKAPLDNNLYEQVLKKAILHRKNSLFYKTEHGAYVGDLFMSLIHTCSLNNLPKIQLF